MHVSNNTNSCHCQLEIKKVNIKFVKICNLQCPPVVVPIWLATANKLYECDDLGPLVNLPIFRSVNGNFTNVSFLFTKAVFPIS